MASASLNNKTENNKASVLPYPGWWSCGEGIASGQIVPLYRICQIFNFNKLVMQVFATY